MRFWDSNMNIYKNIENWLFYFLFFACERLLLTTCDITACFNCVLVPVAFAILHSIVNLIVFLVLCWVQSERIASFNSQCNLFFVSVRKVAQRYSLEKLNPLKYPKRKETSSQCLRQFCFLNEGYFNWDKYFSFYSIWELCKTNDTLELF